MNCAAFAAAKTVQTKTAHLSNPQKPLKGRYAPQTALPTQSFSSLMTRFAHITLQ